MFALSDEPQLLGNLFKDAFRILAQVFFQCIAVVFLVVAIGSLPSSWFLPAGSQHPNYILSAFFGIINLLITAFAFPMLIHWVKNLISNQNALLKDSVAVVKEKYVTVLIAMIFSYVLILIGTFLFVIPGIFLGIKFLFYIFAILFDNEKARSSLRASWEFVQGAWWQSFSLIFVPACICLFIMSFVSVSLSHYPFLVLQLARIFAGSVMLLFFICLLIVQFNNLKICAKIKEKEEKENQEQTEEEQT